MRKRERRPRRQLKAERKMFPRLVDITFQNQESAHTDG